MRCFKKVCASLMTGAMAVSMLAVPVMAVDTYEATLYGRVEDNGQQIYKMVLDYGTVKVDDADTDSFTVHAKAETTATTVEGETVYGYDQDRTIVKVETKGTKVEVYFDEASAGGTLTYLLKGGRNTPAKITYTITQNEDLTGETNDGRAVTISQDAIYSCETTKIVDDETAKFVSKKGSQGINYQLHKGSNDTLIVWFHGNGEGDYNGSENNVAQMLANRGTVAWASDEAKDVFGDATVMAFQAPDTWYYAQRDNLLEAAYKEIQEEMAANGIDASKVYVSGCSAGGYMTTRMLIAYPKLFKAAMINCPALDLAAIRGGETPTDEELEVIKNSDTAVWLVQGETDSSVNQENCAKRMFNYLTKGETLTTSEHEVEIASDFTTYETKNNKYKLSLYETVDTVDKVDSLGETRAQGKLKFAEDYNQDGQLEEVKYSDHWSWIYTLRNNPTDASGTHIWNWAVNYVKAEEKTPTPTPTPTPSNPTPEQTKPLKKVASVKTGDVTSIAPYGMMLLASGVAFVEMKRRKNK